jgi:aminoglycoside phosphotransferase (APT) family kinase protein
MMAVADDALRRRFGTLVPMHDKPLSLMWGACDGAAVLKIYRSLEPVERRDREAQALSLARGWGIPAPAVRDAGAEERYSWLLLDAVGTASPLRATPDAIDGFVRRTVALTAALQRRPSPGSAGPGWLLHNRESQSNSQALLNQLSARCAERDWWSRLSESLAPLDHEPAVYLHGDIKPEHFLDDGRTVHVVDWEAAARGPAVCDPVDAAFHLVRDLVYADARMLHLKTISGLPVTGPAAAWRVVRWLDRRGPDDLALITTAHMNSLIDAGDTHDVLHRLARLITAAHMAGVPR